MARRIRWCRQFSIFSLLVFTALFAVLLAFPIRHNIERNRVIENIKQVGGNVHYGKSFALPYFQSAIVTGIAIPHSSASEFDFTQLSVFPQLQILFILKLPQPGRSGKFYDIGTQVTPESVKQYLYPKRR